MKINNTNIQIDKGDMLFLWPAQANGESTDDISLETLISLNNKNMLLSDVLKGYDLADGCRYYTEYPDAAVVDYIDSQLYDIKHLHVVSQTGNVLLLEDGNTYTLEANMSAISNKLGWHDVKRLIWSDETTLEAVEILVAK